MSESPLMPVYRNPADFNQEPVLQGDIYSAPERQQLAQDALTHSGGVDQQVENFAVQLDDEKALAKELEHIRAAHVIGERLAYARDNRPVMGR